jgi:hypothetical protein
LEGQGLLGHGGQKNELKMGKECRAVNKTATS